MMIMFHGKDDILKMQLLHWRWSKEGGWCVGWERRRWSPVRGGPEEEVKKGGACMAQRNDRGLSALHNIGYIFN